MTEDLSKSYDFSCHGPSGLTCAAVGSKTDVLATAGRDRNISIWAFNRFEQPRVTLTTHVLPECLQFSKDTRSLAYGSMSGSIKLWDYQAQKTISSFSGHKGNIKVLCHNPTNMHIWASGSLDSTVKLWDSRHKRAVATYEVHSKTVTSLQFSPHGAWLATGSDDCVVKLLDVKQGGKIKADLTGHSAPITDVKFHPCEYLLASGSQDKTVRFWDLESYECVSQSDPAGGPVYLTSFYLGRDLGYECLFAACEKGVRILGWEPARVFQVLSAEKYPIDWQRSGLLAMGFQDCNRRLVCLCRTKDGKLAVFTANIEILKPFEPVQNNTNCSGVQVKGSGVSAVRRENTTETIQPQQERSLPEYQDGSVVEGTVICRDDEPTPMLERAARKMRRSFHESTTKASPIRGLSPNFSSSNSEESETNSPEHRMVAVGSSSSKDRIEIRMGDPNAVLTNLADAEEIFKPRPKVRVSPPATPTADLNQTVVFESAPNSEDPLGMTFTVNKVDHSPSAGTARATTRKTGTASPLPERKGLVKTSSQGPQPKKATAAVPPQPVLAGSKTLPRKKVEKVSPILRIPQEQTVPAKVEIFAPELTAVERNRQGWGLGDTFLLKTSVSAGKGSRVGGDISGEKLNPEDFLPFGSFGLESRCCGSSGRVSGYPSAATEQSALSAVFSQSGAMSAVLEHRCKQLEFLKRTWKERGLKAAVEVAVSASDPTGSLVVELLRVLNSKSTFWSLDLCVALLPEIKSLLVSSSNGRREPYVKVAGESLRLILQGFGDVLKHGMRAVPCIGPDVEGEARAAKCKKCVSQLESIRVAVTEKEKLSETGSPGIYQTYREIGILMQLLDQ